MPLTFDDGTTTFTLQASERAGEREREGERERRDLDIRPGTPSTIPPLSPHAAGESDRAFRQPACGRAGLPLASADRRARVRPASVCDGAARRGAPAAPLARQRQADPAARAGRKCDLRVSRPRSYFRSLRMRMHPRRARKAYYYNKEKDGPARGLLPCASGCRGADNEYRNGVTDIPEGGLSRNRLRPTPGEGSERQFS